MAERSKLAVKPRKSPKPKGPAPSAVELQVKKLFGLEPNQRRLTLLPDVNYSKRGGLEFTAPQFLYDIARAFSAPGVALSGQPIDAESEAANIAMNFTGAGSVANRVGRRAFAVDRNALGMSGSPKPKAPKPKSSKPAAPKPSKPTIRALQDIRPSPDDVYQVMDANTSSGKVTGNKMVPIDKLVGGVSNAADDKKRVDALVDAMKSPEGYVARLIVDHAGNVIEGQHRLEALRKLGAKEVPVTEYIDLEEAVPFYEMKDAAQKAQSIHPDHAYQIANRLAEIYADESGNLANLADYIPPEGFENAWNAAVKTLTEANTPVTTNPLSVKATAKAAPNPLHEVALEFGPAIARRLDGMIPADASLSEWREAAARLAAADAPNVSSKAPSPYTVRPASVATDPRIEKRKGELGKIADLELEIAPRVTDPAPEISIFDLEGHPYITSMSDLAAAGDDIISINGVKFRVPFSRRGGQDYMFDNPGSVWASERKPAERHVELAQRLQDMTGKDVLYMPWTMGPNAVQFSHMPRGIQYRYGEAALGGSDRGALEQEIKRILPEWRSFEDPDSAEMFMTATGKARGALNDLMDKYRTRGGLGKGEATYAATDLTQIGAPLTTLKNIGIIDPRFGASPSSHASYNYSIPGRGLGVLKEKNIGALALSPDVMAELGYKTPFDFPVGVQPGTKSPLRAMQMKPQGGLLDYETLRFLEKLLKDSE